MRKACVRKFFQFIAVFSAFLLFLLAGVYLSRLSVLSRSAVTASADVSYPGTQFFPTENLWHSEVVTQFESSDRTLTYEGNTFSNSIVTASDGYAFQTSLTLLDFCPRIVPGTYSFSATVTYTSSSSASGGIALFNSSLGSTFYILTPLGLINNPSSPQYVSRTVEITQAMLSLPVFFYGNANDSSSPMKWTDLTCNPGSTAYPYCPPVDSIYNSGYQSGHEAGYTDGYDEGYQVGLDDGFEQGKEEGYDLGYATGEDAGYEQGYDEGYSNAVNALGTGLLTQGNSTYLDTNLAPSGQGITASATADGTLSMAFTASYNGVLVLRCARQYRNGNKLTITVDSVSAPVIFRTFMVDLENGVSFDYEVFRLEASETGYTKEVTIDLPISTNVGFSTFSMVTESVPGSSVIENLSIDVVAGSGEYYQNGYDQGYEEGQLVGYDQGYDKGYQIGKAETLETISDEDLPSSVRSFVFSLFDAPVSTFLNAFNLSWDGFDFGGLVAFIFTAVVIVGFVKIWW